MRTKPHGPSRSRLRALRVETLEDRRLLDAGSLVVNEFMANNNTTLADGDGKFWDWIEIHNPTASEVDLDGWHLTDDFTELTKWPVTVHFPDWSPNRGFLAG
jgi:hypothetical protein